MAQIIVGSHGLIEDEVVWKVAAGADAFLPLLLVDDATTDPLVPTDLTGFEAASQVRVRLGGAVLADLSTATGEIVIDALAGRITLRLPAAQSRTWTPRTTGAVFDVELYSPDGIVQRLCTGRLDIWPNSTIEEAP